MNNYASHLVHAKKITPIAQKKADEDIVIRMNRE